MTGIDISSHPIFLAMAALAVVLVGCPTKDDSAPPPGNACSIGSDCSDGEYCIYLSGDSSWGVCRDAPRSCRVPVACGDCPELFDPCPGFNIACSDAVDSDFNVIGNPTVSCLDIARSDSTDAGTDVAAERGVMEPAGDTRESEEVSDAGEDSALAPDSHLPDALEDQGREDLSGCGEITYQGECVGDLLRWCDEGSLVEYDCPEFWPSATCAFISGEHGYDCVLQPGDPCYFEDANGDTYPAFCAGSGPGCIVGKEGAVCTAEVGVCRPEDVGYCLDDRLVLDCQITQPFGVDCTDFGAGCSDEAQACVDVPLGGSCASDLLICASGLVCVGQSELELGTCEVDGG